MISSEIKKIHNRIVELACENKLKIVQSKLSYESTISINIEAEFTNEEDIISLANKLTTPFIFFDVETISGKKSEEICQLEVGIMTSNGNIYCSYYFETPENTAKLETDEDEDWPDDVKVSFEENNEGGINFEKFKEILVNDPKFQAAPNHDVRLLVT